MWLILALVPGLNLTSAAEQAKQDGPRPKVKPAGPADAPSERQHQPGLPAPPKEPPGVPDTVPGPEPQPPFSPPGRIRPEDPFPTPPEFPGGVEPPGESLPPLLMPGPRRDSLSWLSELEADEEAQKQLFESVDQSQQRLATLNTDLLDLRKELCAARRAIVQAQQQGDYGRSAQLAATLAAQADLVQAELDVTRRHLERVKILERHLASMRDLEQRPVKAVADGSASPLDRLRARAARLEAEIRLHEERHPSTTPEQLELVHVRVSMGQEFFNRVYIGHRVTETTVRCCGVAKDLAERRAELEFARGEYREALKYQRMARRAARQADEVSQKMVAMGMRGARLDFVFEAKDDLPAIELRLLDWEARYGEEPPPADDGCHIPPAQGNRKTISSTVPSPEKR